MSFKLKSGEDTVKSQKGTSCRACLANIENNNLEGVKFSDLEGPQPIISDNAGDENPTKTPTKPFL